MKCLTLILLTTVPVFSFAQDKTRIANLVGEWKFSLGDNKKFARPDYNDSEWEEIYVPAYWQDEGFRGYHGFAWYRKSIKLEFEKDEKIYIELGTIDDADEVYVNGNLVGATGGMPPNYFTAYNYPRRYFIPAEYLKQNEKNVIAIRVYDEMGAGGIAGKSIGIYRYKNFSDNSFNLSGSWKFNLADNPGFSKTEINDKEWEDIMVPSDWESQGFQEYDGIAWYRKTFLLPKNFKTKDMLILLGKIDDLDEVFINSKFVGSTGDFKRKSLRDEEHTKYRVYSIPDDLLKPGKENVIAVRVYDHIGAGGIYEGPVTILPRNEYKEFWKAFSKTFNFLDWWSYYFD